MDPSLDCLWRLFVGGRYGWAERQVDRRDCPAFCCVVDGVGVPETPGG